MKSHSLHAHLRTPLIATVIAVAASASLVGCTNSDSMLSRSVSDTDESSSQETDVESLDSEENPWLDPDLIGSYNRVGHIDGIHRLCEDLGTRYFRNIGVGFDKKELLRELEPGVMQCTFVNSVDDRGLGLMTSQGKEFVPNFTEFEVQSKPEFPVSRVGTFDDQTDTSMCIAEALTEQGTLTVVMFDDNKAEQQRIDENCNDVVAALDLSIAAADNPNPLS